METESTSEPAHTFPTTTDCMHACMHADMHTQLLSLKGQCTKEREIKLVKPAQKRLWRLILWQISDFSRKFLEAVNRKRLSKSRWSMLTAGTTQEIAERLNGCRKKKKMLFSSVLGSQNPPSPSPPSLPLSPQATRTLQTPFACFALFCFCSPWISEPAEESCEVLLGRQKTGGTDLCTKDEAEAPSSTHYQWGASGLSSWNSISGYCPRCCSPKSI